MVKIISIRGAWKGFHGLHKGFTALGDSHELLEFTDPRIEEADVFLQTNLLKPKFITKGKQGPYEYILKSGKPFLVGESASFRKYLDYTRLGWWSYKWTEGNFNNTNCPPDRWNKFVKETGIKIKDWHSPGDNIILMGQKVGDSSLNKLHDQGKNFYDWVGEIISEIRKYSDRKIIIRPHPRGMRAGNKGAFWISKQYENVEVSQYVDVGGAQGGAGLQKDLDRAWCVVTYNSLSSVEAICEGIPTYAMEDGSMIWPIAQKKISKIENLNYNVDITQWCNDIAYTQWTSKEHGRGESWSHLKPVMGQR